MASNGVKNPSIPPSSELRAAFNELRSFYTHQSRDFFENYNVKTGEAFQNDKTSNFISSILAADGAFFTTDLYTGRNVPREMGITPLTFDSKIAGDVKCYWAGPTGAGEDTNYYKNLLNTLNFNQVTQVISQPVQQKPPEPTTYTVAAGDSLSKIAQNKLGSQNRWKEIYELNKRAIGDNPNIINVGTVLTLPADNPAASPAPPAPQTEKSNAAFFFNKINSKPTQPDSLDNPHVSLYRYGNPYISVSTSASDYCNVFFNGIDNINLSLCVPYLRINIIDRCSRKSAKYPAMSLISFLRSSQEKDENDKIFFDAQPILFSEKNKTLTQLEKKLKNANVIGMEAFQSPNTLLPDPTQILDNPRRLDTSVPLMTLESLTVAIESNGVAALSKKIADLSIVLHDRSRLKDISTLVSAGNFSSLYFEIEWGWTHPHAAAQFDSPIAKYLNALRIREIFAPVSYNMTLQNGGGMNINLRLAGGATVDSMNGSVLIGNFVTQTLATSLFNKFIKSTIENDPILSRDNQTETRPVTTILTSKDRKGQLIDRDFIDKILRYTRQDGPSNTEDTKRLIRELENLINGDPGKQYSNKDGIKAIEDVLKQINVTEFGDLTFDKMSKKITGIRKEDFTTVGAYLTRLVAAPLAATGLYDEVQVHTFTFNDSAGAMASLPISDACINISEIIGKEDDKGSLYYNDAIARATSLLAERLSNPLLSTYMIESRTGTQAKGTETESATVAVTETNSTAVKQVKNDQTPDVPEDFTTPNIKCILRAVPAKVISQGVGSVSNSLANAEIDNTRLIAQIIVYDANATPNPDVIVKAYDYVNKRKTGVTSDLTPDLAKEIAKTAYPSITYGSLNSVIESVSVSTDTNGAIQTNNIIEFGKSLYTDSLKADKVANITELTVFPVSVSVTLFGLPIIERGQEIYLDLGTGTTLDSVYYVSAVRHDLRNMKFSTNLTLIPKGQGTVRGIGRIIENYKKATEKNTTQTQSIDSNVVSAPVRFGVRPII